jgi:secreted trypsin-like serine protease
MKKLLVLSILLSTLIGCGGGYIPGNPAYNWSLEQNTSDFPGLVAVTLTDGKKKHEAWCSGVALTKNIVITAAHCLDEPPTWMVRVTSGCTNVYSKKCKRNGALYRTINPTYSAKMNTEGIWNDLGIIVTKEPIPNIVPAQISDTVKTRVEVVTAGFGKRNVRAGRLWAGKSKIKDHNLYEFETYANGENGTCGGDSGGPAYHVTDDGEYVLAGILSRAYRGDAQTCGGYAYYTIPAMYAEWIGKVTSSVMPVK